MPFDPESGLTLTTTFSVGATIGSGDVDRGNSVVLALDLTGLDGSSGGLIHEQGGLGVGSYIGFRPNGDFIARCGDGTMPSTATGVIIVSAASAPSGDGTLVVEFNETSGSGVWEVSAWWDGTELSGDVDSQIADGTEADWAGTNDGEYLTTSGNLAKYDGGSSSEVGTPVTYTTASGLRYYENQVVTATSGVTGTGALTIGGITIASTGERSISGAGALALGGIQIAATGEREIPASGALALGGAALDSSGSVGGNVSGTGALAAGAAKLAATGDREITGAAALAMGGTALDGSGAVGGVIGGSGALSMGGVAIAATADRTVNGAAALTLGGTMMDGSGGLAGNISGSGALSIGAAQIASTGERTISGIGSLTVGAALLSGTALAGIVYFYSYPEDSARGGTLISPTRGGTVARYVMPPVTAYAAGGFVPSVVAGFDSEFYYEKSAGEVSRPDLMSFARASSATYVDSTGTIQTAASGVPRVGHHIWNGSAWENAGLLIESEARTNLLLNSATLSTQSATVTAVPHTLHFTGTGTVTLTGASTAGPLVGTGAGEENRVSLTFTPTAGSLTLTVSGTVSNAQLEAGPTPSSYIPTTGSTATRAAETLSIPAANLPYSATAMSIAIEGTVTYADEDNLNEINLFDWFASSSNFITSRIRTDSTRLGRFQIVQAESGIVTRVDTPSDVYTPGIQVPFNIASRHGATFINGAVDGTALTEDTTPTALPDLSTTDLGLAPIFMGTIKQFRMWDADISDIGIEEASQ